MKLAAIDIGSNASRLLITEITEVPGLKPHFAKLNLVRVPLRLGFDVFETGQISKIKVGMILQTMKAYSHLLNVYGVSDVKACATSAMRDAKNSQDIIRKVKLETGIQINIISGDEEATIIYENHIAENLDQRHSYLYIDVGGGSTELTFFADNKLVYKRSFNIGTIRLLKNLVEENHWNEMRDAIRKNIKSKYPIEAIGSGGNINKIFSMSKRKDGKPLTIELLKDYYKEFNQFTLEQRIRTYNLRPDRADVIVPALQIYISVMKYLDINEIYVPKIGLADGLIQTLYSEIKAETKY